MVYLPVRMGHALSEQDSVCNGLTLCRPEKKCERDLDDSLSSPCQK